MNNSIPSSIPQSVVHNSETDSIHSSNKISKDEILKNLQLNIANRTISKEEIKK